MARTAGLFARRVLHQGIHFDDIRPPVRELPHAGRPRADPGEIEDGEAGEGLRGAREGHSRNSGGWLKLRSFWFVRLSQSNSRLSMPACCKLPASLEAGATPWRLFH